MTRVHVRGPVRPPSGGPGKRASQIARGIEADIIRRGWPVGQSLGSEQALQQRYHVSRSVLREAVRLVEHHRVARMRRGPNGGLLVCEPDAAPGHPRDHHLSGISGHHDRRPAQCPAALRTAGRIAVRGANRRSGYRTGLRAVLRAEEDRQPDQAAPNDEFHAALAEQSKNPVLQLFIDILIRLTVRYAEGLQLGFRHRRLGG